VRKAKGPLCLADVAPGYRHSATLIYHPPQVVTSTLDGEKRLIEMPFVAEPRRPTTELSRIRRTTFATPLVDGLRGYDYPALTPLLFNTAITAGEAEVQPHGVTDDFARKRMALVPGSGCQCTSLFIMSHQAKA
jgi:hypothetical protein